MSGALFPSHALVLTAGLGTRLRPLTCVRAKPAVPVAGEPLIRRILRWLARQCVRDVVLNLHYKPETITRLVGDGSDLGVRVTYSWEPVLLGSAGGPRHALPLIDADRFFIVNGDTLVDVDLEQLATSHARSDARLTMAVISNPDPTRYGGVLSDANGRVTGFTRAGTQQRGNHFIGVQLAESSVFAEIPDHQPIDSVNAFYPALIAHDASAIHACLSHASFFDIGTPADYLATSLDIARAEGLSSLPVGDRVTVDPTSCVDRTAIWNDVVVKAGCTLRECIVGDGVRIPAGSQFERCAIVAADRIQPGPGETIRGDILIARMPRRRQTRGDTSTSAALP